MCEEIIEVPRLVFALTVRRAILVPLLKVWVGVVLFRHWKVFVRQILCCGLFKGHDPPRGPPFVLRTPRVTYPHWTFIRRGVVRAFSPVPPRSSLTGRDSLGSRARVFSWCLAPYSGVCCRTFFSRAPALFVVSHRCVHTFVRCPQPREEEAGVRRRASPRAALALPAHYVPASCFLYIPHRLSGTCVESFSAAMCYTF